MPVEYIAAAIAVIFSILFCLPIVIKRIIREKPKCAHGKEENSDVYLDDICKRYLRLTNND